MYLLNRGISVLAGDKNGNNTVHYAIQIERVEFLSLLLEGTFESSLTEMSIYNLNKLSESSLILKAQELIKAI